MSPKRKIRKLAVKKRTLGINSSRLEAKEKTKVHRKNKLNDIPHYGSKITKQASSNSKPVTRSSLRMSLPNICDKTRKTRNSLKASQVNITNDKVSLKNVELFVNSKVVIGKINSKKQSVRKSLRLSKSSSSKEKNKELRSIDINAPENTKPMRKKSTKQVTTLSPESAVTPNPEKCMRSPKVSGRKKSARLSTEPQNQEIFAQMPASKSLAITQIPGRVTSGNQKSGRLSKESNRSSIMNSQISLNRSSSHSLLETPQFEKYSRKRKSSRLLEPSPLRTLNKELPFSTPASLRTRNADSTLNKSCKRLEISSSESRCRKQSRPDVFYKDGFNVSYEKQKQKRQVNQHKKTSENFKKPLSNETENFPLDSLTTPAFKPPRGRSMSKKYLSKSDPKSSKRKLNASASENQVAVEELLDAKKRKSAGDNVCVDNSTSPSKIRSRKKDFPKMPTKGTLKHKRWQLNNLKEKNGSYEDDIFENRNLDLYKSAFHFGDESDGSSVNIATPKFDCILTPTLPKKTPRFKDCISPTEFLQARKTAEEYLFRRNKKRKSGDRQSSSAKKTSVNKKKLGQDIPEKKKLDFEEAVNRLITVQKNLENEAEVDDEEEDSYFSDVSN